MKSSKGHGVTVQIVCIGYNLEFYISYLTIYIKLKIKILHLPAFAQLSAFAHKDTVAQKSMI